MLAGTMGAARAQARFEAVGELAQARHGHTATLLADGRVLVAGGQAASVAPLAAAELFDPARGAFAKASALPEGRVGHSATLLPDGRVLVAGGTGWREPGGLHALASAALYEPRRGRWQPLPPLREARSRHSATLLADGRVLVAGGEREGEGPLASAELFDPATASWAPAGALHAPRARHQAVRLADGRVLLTGGRGGRGREGAPLASAEWFDPQEGRFHPGGAMQEGRQGHAVVALPDGRALVLAGALERGFTRTLEWFLPAQGTFLPEDRFPLALAWHTATLLADGRVLVAGGEPASSGDTRLAQLWEPAQSRFCLTANLREGRKGHTATLLADGRVLVAGGLSGGLPTASAEVFSERGGLRKCLSLGQEP